MEKDSGNGLNDRGFQFHKPDERTKWQQFKSAIYDPTKKTCLGRTGKNWIQLLIFYAIFYTVLACLFAICMQGLLASLDDNKPTWTGDSSLIGTNPGLGFRPIAARTEEGSLIWYNRKNYTTVEKWINLVDDFLKEYKVNQTGSNYQECNWDKPADQGRVCTVNLDQFGPCGPKYAYGYNSSSPCVFLKLNKIYGWLPEYYTEPQEGMSDDLKNTIARLPAPERKQIWISCAGEGPVDKEHVQGFNYYPSRGLAGYYYPFTNQKNYLSPLIAVQIENPKENVLISVECRAWAKNILYKGGNLDRQGSVHFEIMQDA